MSFLALELLIALLWLLHAADEGRGRGKQDAEPQLLRSAATRLVLYEIVIHVD